MLLSAAAEIFNLMHSCPHRKTLATLLTQEEGAAELKVCKPDLDRGEAGRRAADNQARAGILMRLSAPALLRALERTDTVGNGPIDILGGTDEAADATAVRTSFACGPRRMRIVLDGLGW